MAVDPMDIVGGDDDEPETPEKQRRDKLNGLVAISVALLATFMGICAVKAGNVGQAMEQAQAERVNQWAYYQARNIRGLVAQSTADQLRMQALSAPATARATYAKQIASYQAEADKQEQKKAQTQKDAEAAGKTYDDLNIHDDQFDLSDALLSISIALLALTALTQKRWLLILAAVPTFFGVLMGLSGLLNWSLHSDFLARLLS